jgi:serine/threonine-protein kinase SRPK3
MQRVTACSNQSTHPGRNHVTYLKNHFELEGPTGKHVCMVMPLLGDSIAEKATTGHIMRIPPPTVRNIAKQMLEALDFLHSECGIIHTDLQPSNILKDDQGQSPQEIDELVRTQSSGPEFNDPNMQFRLNDLGIACFVDQHLTDNIRTRSHARSPLGSQCRHLRSRLSALPIHHWRFTFRRTTWPRCNSRPRPNSHFSLYLWPHPEYRLGQRRVRERV